MSIGDVHPQESSKDQGQQSSTKASPPTQDDDHQEDGNDQGGGVEQEEEEKDDEQEESRNQVPHPRVHQSIQWDHPVDNILGDIAKGVTTRSRVATFCEHYSFVSFLEPLKVEDALRDADWVVAMQDECDTQVISIVSH
jgi:hypothetical protein